MDEHEMQDRIGELEDQLGAVEDERDELEDELANVREELAEANRQLDALKKLANETRDHVRFAHELLEKGDF
jgi:septal ring factor EnvC (AmiA/AmiB activator)